MKTVGAYEAKTHLPRLLEEVARGEKMVITRHGVPIAVLQPYAERDKPDPSEVVRQLRAFRRKRSLGDLSLQELIKEGRK